MIEMKINGLAVDNTNRMPLVLLADIEEKRFLPIWIGVYEADAILVAMNRFNIPRPMTHDLMKSCIEALGGAVERVEISAINNGTYYAKVVISINNQEKEIDSRPSDAIALASRAGAPIFVAESVIMQATIVDKDKYDKEMKEFKEFLKDVKSSDFINEE